jgi:hypothetical protein
MSHLAALLRAPLDLGVFAHAARQRLRRTLGFLALLVLLSTVATTTAATLRLRELVRRLEPHLDALPTIVIEKGEARADVEQPWTLHLFRDDAGHEFVLIIDTTGRRQDFAPRERGLFLQRTQLLARVDDEAARAFSLRHVPDVTIGPEIAHRFVAHWMRRIPFYLGLAFLVWFSVVKLIQALLLSLAALIGGGRALRFGALFSIGVYALGPALLVKLLVLFAPFHVPFGLLLALPVAIAYAMLGGRRAAASLPGDPTS